MRFDQITIVGVGLIGGSIGLAAKARGIAARVVGVGRDAKNLARAVELGAIDSVATTLAEGVAGADIVVVCTPVDRIAAVIREAAPHCRPGTIFTDAGSTKAGLFDSVREALGERLSYLPAHPIAGSEASGVEHARADLFEKRITVVTPHSTDGNRESDTRVEGFWEALGSRVVRMTPEAHDKALAITSHLPHTVAAAVASTTPTALFSLTAGGFRDATRIAAGSPELWAPILQANRAAVLAALSKFTDRLDLLRNLLEAGDGAGLLRWLSEAKQVRDALGS